MTQLSAFVRAPSQVELDRRGAERHTTDGEALARQLDAANGIFWGAVIRDISSTGIGLRICYPFHAGTYLAIDIHGPNGLTHGLLARVVHAHDQADGAWHVGCEFVKPLSASELDLLV